MILGAYLAGLFFREEVANKELIKKVEDRLYGIAYSFLGPIFFISLGFHITFDVLISATVRSGLTVITGLFIILETGAFKATSPVTTLFLKSLSVKIPIG